MLTKKVKIGLMVSSFAFIQSVMAESFYVGAKLVNASYDADASGVSLDDSDTSFGIFGGYSLSQNIAVQLGYQDFGEVDITGANGTSEADAFELSLIGSVNASEAVELFAEVGLDAWDATVTSSGVSADDDGTDLYFGLGVSFSVNDSIDLFADYQFHSLDDTDIDTFGLGIRFYP